MLHSVFVSPMIFCSAYLNKPWQVMIDEDYNIDNDYSIFFMTREKCKLPDITFERRLDNHLLFKKRFHWLHKEMVPSDLKKKKKKIASRIRQRG